MLCYITRFNEFIWHKYMSETNPMNAAVLNELRYLGFWAVLVLAERWKSNVFFFYVL